MEALSVEVEVMAPCVQGQQHPVRLRILSWEEWEIVHNPCAELLGSAFGMMAPCSHYVRRRSDKLRQAVVQRLAKAGPPAVPALTQALKDRNEYVRCAACRALGDIGDPQAIPALIQALGDEVWYVRYAAYEALVKIGKPAVPALTQALGDKDWDVHEAARKALGKLGDAQLNLPL